MSDPGEAALPLPMFPLGTVLFPGQGLPLHIFEPRYRQLARDCVGGDREFGVVLIERGSEVGGGDSRFDVGTVARIGEEIELPDGRWALMATGTRRIQVECWLPDDPYPLALVRAVPDSDFEGLSDPDTRRALETAERGVRRSLAYLAELDQGPTVPATVALAEDPVTAIWQLCAFAPIGPLDQQRLLELRSAGQRVRLLAELASQAADGLAHRLAGG